MFEYKTYPDQSRFILTFSQSYDHDPDAAHRELHEAARLAKSNTPYFDMIVDMKNFSVAPKDRANSGGEMMAWCEANGLRYGAYITESAVLRMQLKRLSKRSERVRYFANRAQAEAWLNSKAEESERPA